MLIAFCLLAPPLPEVTEEVAPPPTSNWIPSALLEDELEEDPPPPSPPPAALIALPLDAKVEEEVDACFCCTSCATSSRKLEQLSSARSQ